METQLTTVSFQSAIKGVEVYGLILINLQGGIDTWNEGARQLLGYTEEEVLHKHFELIFTPEDREKGIPAKEIANALHLGHAYDDRWHVKKDQSRIFVNGGLCLLKTEQGDPLGFVKIIRDQTEKQGYIKTIEELNAHLIQAARELKDYASTLEDKVADRTQVLNDRNKELQDFCYSIAHDIRAPLRGIQGMAEVVLEDYGSVLDTNGREYLARISQAGAKLDRLTLDLLSYTRFSREEIQLTSVSLDKVLDEVLQQLDQNISAAKAEVIVQRPLPTVKGQPAYVLQILINFLSNALKFASPYRKPAIKVWVEIKDGRVRIYLSDNGIGIPPAYQDKIFILFERLPNLVKVEGTGAGLAIARKAAQRMSGEIGILPETREGSTFWLELESAE